MYKIIKSAISKEECENIYLEFESINKQKDKQVVNSDILYEWDLANVYSKKLKSIVEEFYSNKLNTIRSYTRKSFKGQVLDKHKDITEIVMSVFIKQNGIGENPLVLYPNNQKTEILLEVGDGVIFEGSKIFHERPPIVSEWILGMYLGYERIEKSNLI